MHRFLVIIVPLKRHRLSVILWNSLIKRLHFSGDKKFHSFRTIYSSQSRRKLCLFSSPQIFGTLGMCLVPLSGKAGLGNRNNSSRQEDDKWSSARGDLQRQGTHLKSLVYETQVATVGDLTAWIVVASAEIANL
ncbi:hypothetical protein TNCV_1172351 [Trichonephila clavipes]|uniref:Uncharacterized protein n=1 Tax=Trichonephila clavipes TaxID=2585209 RepID=A0A8X6VEN0_TRICX|nr:hypothetical protein TNCV_1172351 [Trichonephila clavipes]